MYQLNGKKINIEAAIAIDGIQYPAGWFSDPLARDAVGITYAPDPVRPDDNFYIVTANDDGSYSAAPRPTEDARAVVWRRIQAHRDSLYEAGCEVAPHGWFHNDVQSRSRWERMVNRATAEGLADTDPYLIGGAQVQWKTMRGAFIPLTAGIIRAVVAAFEVQEAAIFIAAETHRTEVYDMNFGEVAEYDHLIGWPAVYVPEA